MSRRSMLCGLAVALVVPGGLAACSTAAPSTSSGGSTPTGGGSTPTGGTGTAGTGTAQGLASLSEVPEGGGVIVNTDGKALVLARSGSTVKAFDATCPHAGTKVAAPTGGVITCPNHGSQFAAADGKVKKGPATKGLTEVPVKVQGDQIVLA